MTLPPYKNLDEVKDWLNGIGTEVSISSNMFDAAMVNKLLDILIIDNDPIIITNATAVVDGTAPYLSGKTTLMEVPETEVVFLFTEPEANLLLTLNLKMPEAESPDGITWQLIEGFNCGFTNLKGVMSPNEELAVISLLFDCDIVVETFSIPVSMAIPTFEGDWTLNINSDRMGNDELTNNILYVIAGNQFITSILPDEISSQIENFSLTDFQMSFNASSSAQTISLIRIGLQYRANWSFFGGLFVVQNIEFDYQIFNPLQEGGNYQASLIGNMKISDDFPFQVGGQFPNQTVFARLQPDTTISLSQIFEFFHIPLPEGFPASIGINSLGLTFYILNNSYEFTLGISDAIPIAGNVQLDSATFSLGADYDGTGKMFGYGNFYSQFTVGTTSVLLSAVYDESNGVTMSGEAYDLPIGDLITTLLESFELNDYPKFISGITLDKLIVNYNTASGDFSFDCIGTIPVAANAAVAIEVKLTALCSVADKGYDSLKASGIITYTDADGIVQVFEIDFEKDTDTSFAAAWTISGTPIGINYIASLVGLASLVPAIPSDLDLDLKAASFVCNNNESNSMFILTANSLRYGLAVFAAVQNAVSKQWVFFYGMKTDTSVSLSNLPIINNATGSDKGELAIEAIQANVASCIIGPETAKLINDIIALEGPEYPQVPDEGMSDLVVFSMWVNIGGTLVPLSLGIPADEPDTLHMLALTSSAGDSDVYWYQLQKNFGPMYFEKIGLAYRDSAIFILLNCSVTANKLTLTLNGFGIGIPISDFSVTYAISGIGVTFQSGSILVSGELTGTFFDPINLTGQLFIKNKALSIGALGGYTQVSGQPSMFLYAVLNYPIGGPPYMFVTGLSIGFGFNRSLVLPDINGVASFPFVEWAMGINPPRADPSSNIAVQVDETLQTLIDRGTVAVSTGTNWLAAGVKFTSFEILDSFTLLNVVFGTNIEIGLLGLSRLVLPPGVDTPIVYAELALEGSFSTESELVAITGELTANSYVLSKDCHLTGGFAVYLWVAGDHFGEFVVTLGGYNPNYIVPSYFPLVPRLGMNWKVTNEFTIKGEEYFALTCNSVMAGGYMDAVWQSGGIKAWFSVRADFLIMWKPFYYDIRASVSVGASFTINLVFTKVKMTMYIGASVHIWGPDFSGKASVDMGIISFVIKFGHAGSNPAKAISWTEFVKEMLPQKSDTLASPLGRRRLTAGDEVPNPDVCQIIITGGLITELSSAENDLNWIVNGESLILTTQATIPSKTSVLVGHFDPDPDEAGQNTNFGVRPVGTAAADLQSEHVITITGENSIFRAIKTLGKVAKGLWEPVAFDSNGNPKMDAPLDNTTINDVLTGYTLMPYVAPPDQTLPVTLENLLYSVISPTIDCNWGNPYVPTEGDFEGDTVENTIMTALAINNRDLLVQAMIDDGLALATDIDVSVLTDSTTSYLLAEPVMSLLGEEN
ncbi:MAG: DUF6603 domain-containing protein [Flavipsychrobacter sp.]